MQLPVVILTGIYKYRSFNVNPLNFQEMVSTFFFYFVVMYFKINCTVYYLNMHMYLAFFNLIFIIFYALFFLAQFQYYIEMKKIDLIKNKVFWSVNISLPVLAATARVDVVSLLCCSFVSMAMTGHVSGAGA